MTREEAINNLNMISVAFVEPVTKEQGRLIDDTFDMAIKALEQQPCEDVLDKIRAEIEEHAKINQNLNVDRARALCWCLDVIDKYKAENEEESDSE